MAGTQKKPKSKASASAVAPPWVELPFDITANILQRVGAEEILETVQKVCTTWRNVCKHPSMWRRIHLDKLSIRRLNIEAMCHRLVNLSEGQLLDISLAGFGSDALLNHIAQRSSGLRCLSLEFCGGVTNKGLVRAAKRLPLLEELHLSSVSMLDGEVIGWFCRSCPELKSITLCQAVDINRLLDFYSPDVAKVMSQLRHLCVVGNWMHKHDLLAILDRCTHLESLHLEGCSNLRIDYDLGRRLSQQIKHLKLIKRSPYKHILPSDRFLPSRSG